MRRIALLHAWWFALFSVAVVLGLNILLDLVTHTLTGDIIACVYFGLYGIYCLQNYLNCREYHCLFTGPGFLLAAVFMLLRLTGIFDHGYALPYFIFALAALLGHGLEWRYVRRTGSHFRVANTHQSIDK